MKKSEFEAKVMEAIQDLCPDKKEEIAKRVSDLVDSLRTVPPQRFITCGEYFKLDQKDPLYKTIYRFKVYRWDKEE